MTDTPQGEGQQNAAPQANAGDRTERDRIIEAFMALLAEKPFERIELRDIAERANLSLAALRNQFSSAMSILAAHVKQIDTIVLAAVDPEIAEESPRERLFDVVMRRLEALAPHREAVRSLMRSAAGNPGLALALNGMSLRSAQWMLSAADIRVSGSKGMVRAQGLALLYARVLCTFVDDNDSGLSRTMAALDREMARGQRWSGYLDDLCLIPELFCGLRPWRARRRRDYSDESAAA